MKKIFSLLVAASLMLMCNAVFAAEINNKGYIEVEAIYYYQEGVSLNKAQRMAIIEARRRLAEEIGDLNVTSESTMRDLEDLSDTVKMDVSKALIGSKIISTDKDADNNFRVVVRLNVFGGANSLANAVVPNDIEIEDFPPPKFITLDSKYTGLIVDCSGMELSTAIMPKIKSAGGQEVYASQYLERQMIVQRGMVGYSDSVNSDVQRAGSNPLVVKAVFVSDDCDVVVSDEDADKILAANQASNFLNNCMVVFVR